MHTVKMSVLNLNEASESEFLEAAMTLLDSLRDVEELQLTVPTKKIQGTRGDFPVWTNILMTAISTGAFMAVYTIAKDMFSMYANAEVKLEFEDGSSIALKNITRKEAEALLNKHLGRSVLETTE